MTTKELRALLAAATPGPWEHIALPIGDGPLPDDALIFGPDGDAFVRVSWNSGRDNDRWADAAAIAAVMNDAPGLLDVADAARDALGTLEAIDRIADHTGNETGPGTGECDGDGCVACTLGDPSEIIPRLREAIDRAEGTVR